MIYHIVVESELRAQLEATLYRPSSLAADGFTHCSLEPSVIPVANDYYGAVSEPLLLLQIEPNDLMAEVRYEAAAPIPGGGASHLTSAPQFPHVYGPIERNAIIGVGVLARTAGGYAWPSSFTALGAFLAAAS